MIPRADYEELLRRRRIWGVPPEAVAEFAAECTRSQADLRARLTTVEEQLATLRAEHATMEQTITTLQDDVARVEQEKDAIANRPATVREEAVRFVVDAWIKAQAIRDQTQRDIEAAQATAQLETARIRQEIAEERQRHEATLREERERHAADMQAARQRYETEIVMLHERRQRAVAELESLAESLLHQAGHGDAAPAATPAAPADADVTSSPEPAEELPAPVLHLAPAERPEANGARSSAKHSSEDELLVKALDELEAILRAPRKQ